jgi:hypothetical protein
VFSIACGYPDANDSARLGADPIHKMLLDRDPVTGLDLASQPTLSRFENAAGAKELYRMGEALAASVIERHAQRLHNRARLVTIDLDPTDDPTHGAQQLSFFNTHYDSWYYLPVMGFVTFNDEAEQYLCAAVLRPGNVTAPAGAAGILRRLLMMVRHFFPGVRIRIRLDGGFAHPALLDFLDAEPNLEYVVAMAKNSVLQRKAEEAMQYARVLAGVTGETEHVYSEANYAAGSWERERRILIKAEVVYGEGKEPKDNPRFVSSAPEVRPEGGNRLPRASKARVNTGKMHVSSANRPRYRRKHQATPTDHANFNEFLRDVRDSPWTSDRFLPSRDPVFAGR